LSKKGKITALLAEPVKKENAELDQRSDVLVVTDFRKNIADIAAVVSAMDKPVQQLHIEIRLVETLIGDEKQVGLNLPKSINVNMEGAESTVPFSYKPSEETKKFSSWYELPEAGDKLSLGVLTVDQLKATLDYLAMDNSSKLLSNPKVLAMNNKKAVIIMGTNVPIPELSRGIAGDLITYKEKEVSMNLTVVPRINEENKITLQVHPMLEEIVGYTGEAAAPQPITSRREIETTVMVEDGQTVVIGGLIKETENKIEDKIWLLGDIPVLGYLFKHVSTKKEKTDLLIFITTKILK
jgi:type II secretory pathway component GspD/PulD (secretin)